MPKTPPYSPGFRGAAVRLLRSSGRPIPQLAKELGGSEPSLRNWSRQVEADDGRAPGLTSDEREELQRLRVLVEEREILKRRGLLRTRERDPVAGSADRNSRNSSGTLRQAAKAASRVGVFASCASRCGPDSR
jgi:transposase